MQIHTGASLKLLRTAHRKAQHRAVVTLQPLKVGDTKIRARINVENQVKLASSGFSAGTRFRVRYGNGFVEARLDPRGDHVISEKRFPRRDGSEAIGSRIDLRSRKIATLFGGREKVLALYLKGRILFLQLPTAVKKGSLAERLLKARESGVLRVASFYSGIGTLDYALHEGLAKGGLPSKLVFLNDYNADAVDCFLADNPAVDSETRSFSGGIEEVIASGTLPEADMVVMGIPCKGASKLNVATRDNPEMHEQAGHQAINAMLALQAMKWPPVLVIENVLAYATSTSLDQIRRVLGEQGYETTLVGDYGEDGSYQGITSSDFGNIEKRVRMALLAYPKDCVLGEIVLEKSGPSALTVGDIRLPEEQIDPVRYEYGLHLESDKKKEAGWRNRVVDNDARITPSLSAECWKQRVEDPKFRHPTDPTKKRLPQPEEHARLKGQPERLIRSLVHDSKAHSALGNGTVRNCWVEFGRALAAAILSVRTAEADSVEEVFLKAYENQEQTDFFGPSLN